MRRSIRLLLPASLLALSAGCPFPHQHLKQPRVTFAVRDHQGLPLSSAHLSFYGGFIVGHSIQTHYQADASSEGIIRVPRREEWHWFVMPIPDGEAPWVWAWCIAAPGYDVARGQLGDEPKDTVQVRLRASSGASVCPSAPHSLFDVAQPGQ